MHGIIYLSALERHISIPQYVAAVRLAKERPEQMFNTGLSSWWPTTGATIVRQFRYAMNDRINQAVPYNKRGLTS